MILNQAFRSYQETTMHIFLIAANSQLDRYEGISEIRTDVI